MIFKNSKVYDVLKWIALVGLHAVNYAWVELADVWGFPYAVQIGKTISIIGGALGILLGVSSIKYHLTKNAENNDEISDTVDDQEDYYEKNTEDDLEIKDGEIDEEA